MTEYDVTVGRVHYGTQSPWVPGLEKVLQHLPGIHPEVDFLDFIALNPQMWAAHSVSFDKEILPVFTFTRISLGTGEMNTEFLIMFVSGMAELSPEELAEIKQMLKSYTYIDITEALLGMKAMSKKQKTSQVFTSTFVAIEMVRQKMLDRIKEDN